MLIDKVKVHVKAGDGGNGSVSFWREKYVSHGGPDGGDGGCGGNIVLTIAEGENTLLAYKNRRKFVAGNGGDGKGGKIHGATAPDLVLPVPPGTIVRDADSGKIIKDMSNCEPFILCRGGRGGWGNRHFATPTRQIPRFAKSGITGEERDVVFELKMLADVGLCGLPNVGKSTILSVVSNAKPKIADYQFTTLSPNLGVVRLGDSGGYVVADIPGLIEGAADGAGLGHDFLRHIDRCRLLVHVVDATSENPVADIETIDAELRSFDENLASRPQIIAVNKCDLLRDDSDLSALEEFAAANGREIFKISAATTKGVSELAVHIAERLRELPPLTVYEPDEPDDIIPQGDHEITIRRENDTYIVEGEWLFRLCGSVNFEDRDSLRYFQRVLKNAGVIEKLEQAGVTDGDTVSVYDFEFDFVK